MTTKISSDNIQSASLDTIGGNPKIANIQITDASYAVTSGNAVPSTGGYIKITGTRFNTGVQVLVNNTPATSVTRVSDTELNVQVPSRAVGAYNLYVINSDGSFGLRPVGLNYYIPTIQIDYLVEIGRAHV